MRLIYTVPFLFFGQPVLANNNPDLIVVCRKVSQISAIAQAWEPAGEAAAQNMIDRYIVGNPSERMCARVELKNLRLSTLVWSTVMSYAQSNVAFLFYETTLTNGIEVHTISTIPLPEEVIQLSFE